MVNTADIDNYIHIAMREIANDHGHFGVKCNKKKNLTKSGFGEEGFQIHLCEALNRVTSGTNWKWTREVKFRTDGLANTRAMSVDIVGTDYSAKEQVLIELKYVTSELESGVHKAPSNEPAFPYDILKDCIKIELALQGIAHLNPSNSKLKKETFIVVYGVSIGLTNWEPFWDGMSFERRCSWAINSYDAVRKALFSKVLLTEKNGHDMSEPGTKLEKTIFHHERCHLSFGLDWSMQWINYLGPSQLKGGEFRYVYLSPKQNEDGPMTFLYRHHQNDPLFIPFLNINAKMLYMKERAKWRPYVN